MPKIIGDSLADVRGQGGDGYPDDLGDHGGPFYRGAYRPDLDDAVDAAAQFVLHGIGAAVDMGAASQ